MQVPPLEETRPRDVLQWLATTKESWLIILDNCDDDRIDFAKYIPSSGGSVIITTRLTECWIHGTWENIDELGKEDATQLLPEASGLEHGDQTALISVAESVVSILGQHALALVHAGAYIKRGYCTLNEYVNSFRDEQIRLIKFRPNQQASRHGSVYTTFEVSAIALACSDNHDSHLALRLLNILAFFDREGVEEEILNRAFDESLRLERSCGLVWEEYQTEWSHCFAVSDAADDSFVNHSDEPGERDSSQIMTELSCARKGRYRCATGCGAQERQPIEPRSATYEPAISIPKPSSLPNTAQDVAKTDCYKPLVINHSPNCPFEKMFSLEDDGEIYHLDIWHPERIRMSGLVEGQKSKRLRAACIRLADLSLVKSTNNKISMHPVVHEWARTRLGEVARQDAWEQALSVLTASADDAYWIPLMEKIVLHTKTCIRALGEKAKPQLSLNVARALFCLANICRLNNSDPEVSLAIFEALSISCELQPHTRSVKDCVILRRKAECLGSLGKHEQMQICVDEVVQSTTRWFESDSPEVYSSQMLLADVHRTAGRFQDAIDLLETLYERNSRTSVLDDQEIRELLSKRAQVYENLGNNERAINLLIEELEVAKRASPPNRPGVRDVLYRLSELYLIEDQAEKTMTLLGDAFKQESEQPDHTWFLITTGLVKAYLHLHRYDQAIPILEEMRLQYSRVKPNDKRARADTMHKLAIAYIGVNEPSRAAPLLEEVIELNRLWLPFSSLQLHAAIDRLAMAYFETDNSSQAAILFEEVVELKKSSLPLDDAGLLESMSHLGMVYYNLGRPDQTVRLLEQTVEIDRSSLPPDDPGRLASLVLLAQAYSKLRRLSQARGLLQEVVEIERSSLPSDDVDRLATLYLLAQAHIDLKQPRQALEFLEELVKCRRSSLPPNHKDLVFSIELLAGKYLNLDRPSQAVTLLEDVVKDPLTHSSEGHSIRVKILADAYFMLDKPDHAVTLLEELVESLPADNSERPSNMLADAYLKVGKPSQAVTLLEKLVKGLSKDNPGRLFNINLLAEAHLMLDDPNQVVASLEEVVKSLPVDTAGRPYSTNLLADAYLRLEKPSQAVKLLGELVKYLPADAPDRLGSMNMLADAYLRLGNPNQVVTLLEQVVRCTSLEGIVMPRPALETAYSKELLADAYLRLEKPLEATTLLEELIGHLPADAPRRTIVTNMLAEAYLELGKPHQAIRLLEQVVKCTSFEDIVPSRPALETEQLTYSKKLLADAYLRLDRPDEATTLLEEMKSLPDDPSGEWIYGVELLGLAFWRLGECEKAVPLLERIIAWNNSNHSEDDATRLETMSNLAKVCTRIGTCEKVKEAVSLLEKVMEKGKETLHADPEHLKVTQERLHDAWEKLRQVSGEQLPANPTRRQESFDVATNKFPSSAVYRHARRFMKRCLALTGFDDDDERNIDDKRPRLT